MAGTSSGVWSSPTLVAEPVESFLAEVPATPRVRIRALDGLRGFSAALVLMSHAAIVNTGPRWFAYLERYGIAGVQIFFVISGFIITHLLLKERQRTGTVDLTGFWRRRALRILPPFFGYCAGVALIAALGLFVWDWHAFITAITFTKNLFLPPRFEWLFWHTWSLSVEEQFYLVWPLMFFCISSHRRARLWLAAIILAGVVTTPAVFSHLPKLSWLLPYWPYLAAGCWIALAVHDREFAWLERYYQLPFRSGLAMVVVMLAAIVTYWRWQDHWHSALIPVDSLLMPLAASLLVIEAIRGDGLIANALSCAPLYGLGRISYSVYLWQQLFLPYFPKPGWYSHWPLNILSAIVCGAISYVIIETPIARWRARLV